MLWNPFDPENVTRVLPDPERNGRSSGLVRLLTIIYGVVDGCGVIISGTVIVN